MMTFVTLRTNYEAKRFMFRKIKYSDQYLAKTLFKRTLFFVFLIVNVSCSLWYWAIFQAMMSSKFSWWDSLPIGLSIFMTIVFGWSLFWFYKHYAPTHADLFSRYLKRIELRQMISL